MVTVTAGRRAWSKVDRDWILESWSEQIRNFMTVLENARLLSALEGASYGADALAEQDAYTAPTHFVDTQSLIVTAPDGRSVQGLLESPAYRAKTLIGEGMSPDKALSSAGGALDRILTSILADTSRQAAQIDIASRPGVGYIRQLVGASCPDCVILAGRFYRWNAGFKRHPGDDCIHVPASKASGQSMVTDPYEHFRSMTREQQDAFWGPADAQAIRDGADIYRVGNARRGAKGMFTNEGMGRRGFARESLNPRQRRLTPEGIYRLNPRREDALRELARHGYILPGGQVPGGSIRGAFYEGFGALGRGGTRRAASEAVLAARESGIRVGDRYTMTAAERRLADAERRWQLALQGKNPFTSPGFGNTADPLGLGANRRGASSPAPLTPQIAAQVERSYRRWLASNGQIFTK